jgi:hypothetical protein
MQTVLLHLERLRRHYNNSALNYDHVSLLDLSHALRVWTELKVPLRTIEPGFTTTLAFKTAIPAKKVLRAARGSEFVIAYMPGGVITRASKGELASAPKLGPFTQTIGIKKNGDGSIELKNFCFVGAVLEQPIREAVKAEDQTRCNYENWLGAEAVRLCYPPESGGLKTVIMSREMLIKRVANTLDGSHPSAAVNVNENSFDPAIHYLLQYKMGGLPLPYFILLKIAQDILSVAPKLLGLGPLQGAR